MATAQLCVADDGEVGRRVELRGVETLEHLDVGVRELIAHGRIENLVGPRDLVSGLSRNAGEPSHERASNAQKIETVGHYLRTPTAARLTKSAKMPTPKAMTMPNMRVVLNARW